MVKVVEHLNIHGRVLESFVLQLGDFLRLLTPIPGDQFSSDVSAEVAFGHLSLDAGDFGGCCAVDVGELVAVGFGLFSRFQPALNHFSSVFLGIVGKLCQLFGYITERGLVGLDPTAQRL